MKNLGGLLVNLSVWGLVTVISLGVFYTLHQRWTSREIHYTQSLSASGVKITEVESYKPIGDFDGDGVEDYGVRMKDGSLRIIPGCNPKTQR